MHTLFFDVTPHPLNSHGYARHAKRTATSVPGGKTTEYDGAATGAERGGWRKAPASEGAKGPGTRSEDLLF